MAKEAIFFDDLQENIDNVGTCVGIEAVKVHSGSKAPNPETADKNFYAAYLDAKDIKIQYYEGSGIGQREIPVIRNWLANIPKYAIFDWDQTLTQCAGIYLPLDKNITNAYSHKNNIKAYSLLERFASDTGLKVPDDAVEQTLNYLFGGPRRLVLIRGLMKTLHDNGVEIVILTNNSAALHRPFEQLVEVLLEDIPFRIICSSDETPANMDKRLAIEMDEKLGPLCGLAATMPPSANSLVATVPPKGSGLHAAALAAAAENNNESNNNGNMLVAATPSSAGLATVPKRRGGRRRRRTIKLRRFMQRLKATRHRRNGTRRLVHKS